MDDQKAKAHRKPQAGPKAERKKKRDKEKRGVDEKTHNKKPLARSPRVRSSDRPCDRAFAPSSGRRAIKAQQRNADISQKRTHVPLVNRTPDVPAPYIVAVVGPPQVGKTTLIRSLVKNYTKQNISEVKGPITVISGKKRRLTFVECPNDLNSMIDIGKVADLVLLMIDASFGFEMETFEFLNIIQTHGMPRVMGVLTHLDRFKDAKKLRRVKKRLKGRFWTEIYQGAKLFYLSGLVHGRYSKTDVHNLARFISVLKFRPLSWRTTHPYLLVDRLEDVTDPALVQADPACPRTVALYGYARGTGMRPGARAHLCGVGDVTARNVAPLPDPCPPPNTDPNKKRRSLNEKEKLLYAPMADLGDILYDKDAVYINIPDSAVAFTRPDGELPEGAGPGEAMVIGLQRARFGMDEKLKSSSLEIFPDAGHVASHEWEEGLAAARRGDDDDEEGEGEEEDEEGEGEEGGSGEEERETRKQKHDRLRRPAERKEADGTGRVRRRAVFGGEEDEAADDEDGTGGEEEASESEVEEEGEEDGGAAMEEDGEEDLLGEKAAGSGDEEAAVRWKEKVAANAAKRFRRRANFMDIIYGPLLRGADDRSGGAGGGGGGGGGDSEDEFFKPAKRGAGAGRAAKGGGGEGDLDVEESSKWFADLTLEEEAGEEAAGERGPAARCTALHDWDDPEVRRRIRNKFVTGDWSKRGEDDEEGEGEAGADGAELDESGSEGDELYGDFEDLETGQAFGPGKAKPKAGGGGGDDDEDEGEGDEEDGEGGGGGDPDDPEAIRARKARAKEAFDAAYDEGDRGRDAPGGAPGEGGEEGGKRKKRRGATGEEAAEEAAVDAARKRVEAQEALNKAEFAEEDAWAQAQYLGVRAGQYVRVEAPGVPCELIRHFDPRLPLVLGGLNAAEDGFGFLTARIKRHRWFKRTLKNRDPLIFSLGWRRFQSVPIYAIQDTNGRHRMLKYTPEHMHCLGVFFGPVTPPNTGFVAFQSLSNAAPGFRVSATGTLLEQDRSVRVVKKLKLTGTPFKVFKNTAFIREMFTSPLEVAKFEGARLRTVSGVRGQVKKALKSKDGDFRATFEDKIQMSDIVFLRAWTPVEPPRLYNPVTSRLVAPPPAPAPAQAAPAAAAAGVSAGSESEGEGAAPAAAAAGGAAASTGDAWQKAMAMKTVAQLRRERALPVPLKGDSLYKPIEREPKRFNPLRIPKTLQAALPFAAKPKMDRAKRKREAPEGIPALAESLGVGRARILEPKERKVATLIQQINTIRNEKARKRKESNRARLARRTKEVEKEEAKHVASNKERRKRRYQQETAARIRSSKKARGGKSGGKGRDADD
eukprot:tig00000478_g1271.t1